MSKPAISAGHPAIPGDGVRPANAAPPREEDGRPDGEGSAAFVSTLRARPGTIRIGNGTGPTLTVRVQMPEVWDTVRVELSPDEPVLALKVRALAALFPDGDFHEDFVLKLRGFEVLDENASVAQVGAVDGSIFLLTHRRRRPVR